MANNSTRRGMSPVAAFLIGFLVAFVLVLGSIAGIVFFALNYKLDKVAANKSTDDDGNTRYIYINADPETGGVETVLDLITKVMELTSDDSLTIGKIESLLPIAGSLTDKLQEAVADIIELDMDEVKSKTFSELGGYFEGKVMEIRPAALIDKFGGSELTSNVFIDVVLNGKESDYVEDEDGKYPVYYELFTKTESGFVNGEGFTLRENQEQFLTEKDGEYRLYYFNYGNSYYITGRSGDNTYFFNTATEYVYNYQSDEYAYLTGNYYFDAEGNKIEVNPVTLGTIADGSALAVLDEMLVTDMLEGDSDGISNKILGNITVGELVSGSLNFEEIINGLEISEFIDIDPTNNIMMYLAYGITGVFNDGQNYKGNYTVDGNHIACYIQTEEADGKLKVSRAYYTDESGEEVEISGTTVDEMDDRLKNITEELALSDLIAIKEPTDSSNNAIMIFLAYSVSDLERVDGEKYAYTAKYYSPELDTADENYLDSWQTCYINVNAESGEITDVYILENGVEKSVLKTCIADVSAQINRLTKTLKLKDVVKIDSNSKVMVKLGDYVLDHMSEAVDGITLDDFINATLTYKNDELAMTASEVILAYMNYGITDIREQLGALDEMHLYTHTGIYHTVKDADGISLRYDCYILTEENDDGKIIITNVYYTDENGVICEVAGTTVKSVTKRISGVTSDITIGQIMKVDGNRILSALSGSTIDTLSADISSLAINELYAENIYAGKTNTDADKKAVMYLAVDSNPVLATEYNAYYIYYTFDGNEYSLASTTGKLAEEDFDSSKHYTLGERAADGETVYLIKYDSAYLYYTKDIESGKYQLINAGGEDAGRVENFGDDTYYTYGAASALWKLLLYVTDENGVKTEKAYSVNNLTTMITNVTKNTQNTTMRELHEAGIMKFEKEEDLDLPIKGTDKTVGDLTLENLVSNFVGLIRNGSGLIG